MPPLRHAVLAVLTAALLIPSGARAGGRAQTLGDALQLALPMAAAVCAAQNGRLAPFAGRLAGQIATTHVLKRSLKDSPIDRRPDGGTHGFPSGHTGVAFFGASALSRTCLTTPSQKIAVYSLATLVGASRIAAEKHTLGQVVAGAALGVMFDRVEIIPQGGRTGFLWRHDF